MTSLDVYFMFVASSTGVTRNLEARVSEANALNSAARLDLLLDKMGGGWQCQKCKVQSSKLRW